MNLLNKYNKIKRLRCFLRGYVYNVLFFGNKAKNLSIGKGCEIFGNIELNKNVVISNNVKIYRNVIIDESAILGDNVEIRCNRDNKIHIKQNCSINRNTIIIGMVTIEKNCLIAPSCVIVGSNHEFSDSKKLINQQNLKVKGIVINENVWIGANTVILDGVTIGSGAVIGAGSVVTKNIEDNSIAVGNPCKVIKSRI
ncbi:MAG: acyltransferase [Bacteroidales bacterium]|nr:acyltransferase [Bacteroidales bacterium]